SGVAGPVISGLLVAIVNPGWVLAIDAATFVVSALSLALLRIPRGEASPRAGFWKELVEGWQAVTSRRWYVLNLGSHALWNFAIAGPLADHVGASTTLVLAACLLAVPSCLIVLVPGVRSVRRTPDGTVVASPA